MTAVGGYTGAWIAIKYVIRIGENQQENQPPELLTNLIGYGFVFSSLIGGLISLTRGRKGDRNGRLLGLITFGCGIAILAAISPGAMLFVLILPCSLFYFIGIWPFALIGALVALATLWTILRFVGIRNESDLAMPFRGSAPTPLSKVGLSAIAISFVLPSFPYLKDSLDIHLLSWFLFLGGLLLYGAAHLLHNVSRSRERESYVVEPTDAADSL
ncbi:MAG: hypothetical protein EBS30_09460 [Planctomycetes bacterium]|nr:hypothetical protein [Planctomycetota bacterium]